eukprot:CAMPEP_0184549940 /NCGR_PEP_ID=MMETSP0199_2-20130426/12383_1 /TAXON_ID=1112570 /ORGANISM="Thraustochytrium sp., Strain LLF1b" /LENGTH=308 /DNA_ID=CAMNT_0026944691 /DNA_START=274 /DNA_END=1200 /DNA_ORIENTATION=+
MKLRSAFSLCVLIVLCAFSGASDTSLRSVAQAAENIVNESEPEYFVRMMISHASGETETVVLRVIPSWAPLGAEQFKKLVKAGFYNGACFFRVIKDFMAQVGIPASPATSTSWRNPIQDDSGGKTSNKRGHVTFATSGPNSRTFQIFFNYGNNQFLDRQGFTPFAKVESGMDVIDNIYVTGEGAPFGPGPSQGQLQREGNAYLKKNFPQLSCIRYAFIIPPKKTAQKTDEKEMEKAIKTVDMEDTSTTGSENETNDFPEFGIEIGGVKIGRLGAVAISFIILGSNIWATKVVLQRMRANSGAVKDLDA